MGVTHSNKKTYPRAADVIGYCTPEQALDVAREVLIVQRDNGNRKDRKVGLLVPAVLDYG
jgi:sulfite reductase (NADPH) hemoprotein beta-component